MLTIDERQVVFPIVDINNIPKQHIDGLSKLEQCSSYPQTTHIETRTMF